MYSGKSCITKFSAEKCQTISAKNGESLNALETLAKEAGAEIVCRAAVLAELDSVYRDDIIFLKEHFVFTPNEDGTFTPIESPMKKAAKAKEAETEISVSTFRD